MPWIATLRIGTVAANPWAGKPIRRIEMKILVAVLLIAAASSQFACAPLVAGGVGAAVGVAAERDRQDDKREEQEQQRERDR
jgi:hypothetical protein